MRKKIVCSECGMEFKKRIRTKHPNICLKCIRKSQHKIGDIKYDF